MYSVVLAAMLTTGEATPAFGRGCHGCYGGCHGCRGGCYGGCFGCFGGCSGCRGCYGGCYGCAGCFGSCYGCSGCSGCFGGCYGSCSGCFGGCSGCAGCFGGCYGSYSSCFGCYGSCYGCGGGGVMAGAPVAAPPQATASAPAPANAATVVASLPAGATLYVDGQQVPMESATKTFTTPALEPGKSYYYTMKAVATRDGRTLAQTQQVQVMAGSTARVAFRDLKAEGPAPAPAKLVVRLPAEARLFVDGVPCPLTSATRSFDTPKLEPGKSYYYTLKAELTRDGRTRSQSQRVLVQAGKQVTVEFTRLLTEQTASR